MLLLVRGWTRSGASSGTHQQGDMLRPSSYRLGQHLCTALGQQARHGSAALARQRARCLTVAAAAPEAATAVAATATATAAAPSQPQQAATERRCAWLASQRRPLLPHIQSALQSWTAGSYAMRAVASQPAAFTWEELHGAKHEACPPAQEAGAVGGAAHRQHPPGQLYGCHQELG